MRRNEYKVFSEGKIASLTVKNRLVRSATYEAGMTEDGRITDGMLSLYRNLAQGGVGMIITGVMGVMPEGKSLHKQVCIWDDSFIDDIARIADVVHGSKNNCIIMAQLHHGGRQRLLDGELVGPSAVPSPVLKKSVRALSAEEIQNIIQRFSTAIVRVQKAGFDGVQLHGGHGYLLSSFLSPYTNRRTDYYGGSTKNRVNIIREIVSSARETVGDFPMLIKMNSDDFLEGGINRDTFPELAMEVEKAGIDAIEVSGGMWDCLTRSEEELGFFPLPIPESRTRIKTRDEQSYFSSCVDKLNLSIPVMLVGGNKNIEHMEEIMSKGKVEFFSLSRPLVCEPNLPNRWLQGQGSATCECLSCNLCILTLIEGPVHCMVKHKTLKQKEVEEMTPYLWKLFPE